MNNSNLIKVSGAAMLKVAPDMVRIRIDIDQHFDFNQDAYEQAKANALAATEGLTKVGIEPQTLKTAYFNIEEHSEPVYEKKRFVRYIKKGYTLHQRLLADMPATLVEKINSIVRHCTETIPYAEIKLDTFIANPRQHRLRAIANAVNDAKEKAEIIAATLGCSLGDICEVKYGSNGSEIYDECCYSETFTKGSAPLNINGEDEEIEETVQIYWHLLNH